MTTTTLLSLDTSTSCSGYAIFKDGKYTQSGCIDLTKCKAEKFPKMIMELFYLIDSVNPDIIVVEEMVVVRNASVARHLTMILGAIYGKCLENHMSYDALRPTEWRKLIDPGKKPRKREELKEWSRMKVRDLFGINVNDDESDAILIGQAYINLWS